MSEDDGIEADNAGTAAREAMRLLARAIACQYSASPSPSVSFCAIFWRNASAPRHPDRRHRLETTPVLLHHAARFRSRDFEPEFIIEAFYDMAGDAGVAWLNE
ncbi:hypothetical protein OH491_27420 (plasmid) [Termitidicoccus mucosus]|uniref:hypothetical protein n=1 Tax=Termitidicoccus mucosus TaxID=1184151 RepID=UPI0031846828